MALKTFIVEERNNNIFSVASHALAGIFTGGKAAGLQLTFFFVPLNVPKVNGLGAR